MKAAAEEVLPGRVDRVTLFGSTARGEATEDSDFDLLVVLDEPTFRERASVIDRLAETALERSVALSPVVLARREWLELIARERRFPVEVERDGISA
jgi:predicted nucleotidyltransferase